MKQLIVSSLIGVGIAMIGLSAAGQPSGTLVIADTQNIVAAPNPEVPTNTSASSCPQDMIEVQGNYCPEVQQECLKWLDDLRCAEFKSPSVCLSPYRQSLHFCMSKFEYPGTENSYPLVGIDYYQAKELTRLRGRRLCTIEEFNFACEGEDMHPYGYGDGFHRDASVCNIDKPWKDYSAYPRETWNDHDQQSINQSVPSNSSSQCQSPFGIINMNGNVDEILASDNVPYVNLSGGYWSVVRNRCRPKTTAHNKYFAFYQVGFRECQDIR